jgi:predicted nuclease of restriction endonuclease-like RecB superfamily
MLPSELLMHRLNGETVVPKRLKLDDKHQAIATELIAIFESCKGQTQSELDRQLQELEGDTPDYRVKRGLAHILKSSFSTFEIISPMEPQELRRRVFELSAQVIPSQQATEETLVKLADKLTQEFNREVVPSQITQGLYADLIENRILTQFDTPTTEDLIHRYNLAQVQGIFYRASHMTLNVHRNDPGEYKLLFRYLKLFQLMSYIEGDVDYGFTITVDGATSLFGTSTRYGLAIAKLLPALLHVTKWSLQATLVEKDTYSKQKRKGLFTLDSDCGLVSHYPAGKMYDSALEASFAEKWADLKTEWKLEREVDLIPIPGSVMIPDFRLVHPDGRSYLLEIVGYWRPEYLRKKFSQVRQANCENLILAISERLNLEKAGVKVSDTPALTVWFKDKLLPKSVLQVIPSES